MRLGTLVDSVKWLTSVSSSSCLSSPYLAVKLNKLACYNTYVYVLYIQLTLNFEPYTYDKTFKGKLL